MCMQKSEKEKTPKIILPRSSIFIKGKYVRVATKMQKVNGEESDEQREIRLGKALEFFKSSKTHEKYLKNENLSQEEKEAIKIYYELINGEFLDYKNMDELI